MEEVAIGLKDLPVVMRVPRLYLGELIVCGSQFSLLGYGDIVIPGAAFTPRNSV